MNATTRSGTNKFHGEVYDFLRNSAFDARNYFNTTNFPQDPFRQNQFGGTLGGPIKTDRMFFFVNYEGIRQLLGSTVLPTVPDTLGAPGHCALCGRSGSALWQQWHSRSTGESRFAGHPESCIRRLVLDRPS